MENESLNASRKRRRVSYTTEARLRLLLTPIIWPILLVLTTLIALEEAARRFGATWWAGVRDDASYIYRKVYRPARYGSVWDDLG